MGQTPRPAADSAVRIGQVYLGKYRVDSILGQGGMGVVAECTHLQLNERVAIKMLRPDVLLDPDAVERFMREAQAAVKLKSEYVARVSDVGTLENNTPYMVMEFLEGEDLGKLIDERGHLPVAWSTELILQTCEALAEAHSIGIVHRDIKPANLFVTWRPDGTSLIKVLDFGISKVTMGTDMQLTQTQSLLGTPAYMSPEQMRSARMVDGRTDMWSLGTVMYELLEGRKPFVAESFSEMCVKVAVDAPAPMTNTPFELQQVVLRCLAKSPEQRYPTMADLGRDLIPFAPDPHQAALLVERMQRMLRRSEATWEGSTTGTGLRGIPSHVRDPASSPSRAWHTGSDPAATPFRNSNTPLPGPLPSAQHGIPQPAPRERSAPARAQSEMQVAIPSNRARKGIGIGIALMLLFIGGGIAIGLGTRKDEAGPSQKSSAPVKADTVEVKVETPVVPTKVDPVPATNPVVQSDPVKPIVPGDETAKTVKGTGKTVKSPKTGKVAKTGKEVEVVKETVVPVVPVEQKKCNPFDNAHNCDKKK